MIGERCDGYLAECIREGPPHDVHIIKTPEGQYYRWEPDWKCDCFCCREEDPQDHCYLLCAMEEQEYLELTAGDVCAEQGQT
ncbi:MAG: hypothetical protein WC030_03695 [Candidatus Paceibacterota bacterium]